MAIPINKYIDIVSGVAGRDLANRRDFMGLVITASEEAKTYFVEQGEQGEDGIPWISEFTSDDEVREAFGANSAEYRFALKYFSFVSKSVTRPKFLKFAYWEKEFPTDNKYAYTSYAQRGTNYAFAKQNFDDMSPIILFSMSLEGLKYNFSININDMAESTKSTNEAFYSNLMESVNQEIGYLHVDAAKINRVMSLDGSSDSMSIVSGRDYYHFELQIAKDENGNDMVVEGRPLVQALSRKYYPAIVPRGTKVRRGSYNSSTKTITYATAAAVTNANGEYFAHYDPVTGYAETWELVSTHPWLCGEVCGGADITFDEGFDIFGIGSYSKAEIFKNESAVDAISRISEQDDNFGTFMFLEPLPNEEVMNLAVWNHNKNFKFLFSYSAPIEQLKYSGLATALAGYEGTVLTETPPDEIILKTHVEVEKTQPEVGDIVDRGYYTEQTNVVQKQNEDGSTYLESQTRTTRKGFYYYTGYIPMVLFASTKYNRPNSTKTFMYQTFGTSAAGDSDSNWYLRDPGTVDSLNVASIRDKSNINYIGETQQAGKIIRFYQDGYNTSGLDTACYCNEVWLKDAIMSEILNSFLVNEKLPANNVGEAIVKMRIMGVVEEAVSNGTILVNKALTNSQKEYVNRMAGEETAADSVVNNGYWLSITLRGRNSDKSTAYTADYVFIYAKGDAIRKVEGSNILL